MSVSAPAVFIMKRVIDRILCSLPSNEEFRNTELRLGRHEWPTKMVSLVDNVINLILNF